MREDEGEIIATTSCVITASKCKKEAALSDAYCDCGFWGKGGKYFKVWALAAMSSLALCSMLTASLTLKCSPAASGNLSHHFDSAFHSTLDILEVEEREKKVKSMWNVYNRHSNTMRFPSFWQVAFEAAYEDLVSEVDATHNAAVSEIAKMSLHPSLLYDVEFEEPALVDKTRAPRKKDGEFNEVK